MGVHWVHDVAWPLLGDERRLFIDMQWALIDQLVPMIKALDRRVEHVGREIPAVALLETVPASVPTGLCSSPPRRCPSSDFARPATWSATPV